MSRRPKPEYVMPDNAGLIDISRLSEKKGTQSGEKIFSKSFAAVAVFAVATTYFAVTSPENRSEDWSRLKEEVNSMFKKTKPDQNVEHPKFYFKEETVIRPRGMKI